MQAKLKKLEETFIEMHNDGFDISKPLKWGFYFFDWQQNSLKVLSGKLQKMDFSDLEIDEIDLNEWRLTCSKIAILSASELHKLNIELNNLCNELKVDLYDGWDVEKL